MQNLLRPSPLAPLPSRERGIRKTSYSPSPVLGEGVGGRGQFGFCVSPKNESVAKQHFHFFVDLGLSAKRCKLR